jgi:hypothetical protein
MIESPRIGFQPAINNLFLYSFSRTVDLRGGLAVGIFRMPGDFDVLQPVFVWLDDDIGGN